MNFDKHFWTKPDDYLCAIILDENGKQAYAIKKDGLALLKSLPPFETGYKYYDIVKVTKESGQQKYRDDFISIYNALEIYCPSDNYTFQFKAIISDSSQYFQLSEWFAKHNQASSLVWKMHYEKDEWNKCFCSAKNLAQAIILLEEFKEANTNKTSNFQFKDIELCQ